MVTVEQDGSHATKDRLIDRAIAYVKKHGLVDTSLRAVAAPLGTSHRMLIYHFGSAEEFWDAVMARIWAHDRQLLTDLAALGQVPWIEETWAHATAPRNLQFSRLMFEVYGRALRDRKRFRGFLSRAVDDWVGSVADALHRQFELTPSEARLQARLRVAVLRGLLLDLVTTGDRDGTTQALHLFAKRMRLTPRPRRGPP